MWQVAKVKAVLSSGWEVVEVEVEGKDGMTKMMSMGKGGAAAEARKVSHQILHPKKENVLPT